MRLSIIIPTHNRAESLKRAMESIVSLRDEVDFEIVIVDNNSTDNTKKVTENYSRIARYVFEGNTSFTKARGTGAENAAGDIFLYLDDDVVVHPKSLISIIETFKNFPDCGIIASKILPYYESEPPDWTLSCQQSFNGWSLYNPVIYPHLGIGFQEVTWSAGPMMAISRKAYMSVDGFPPDTVGVETDTQESTFRKLYVGPGDYGICDKIRKIGLKVYYVPNVSCFHVIPPERFTVSFWRSRMIGEAHHKAITNREFFNFSKRQLWLTRLKAKFKYKYWMERLYRQLKANEIYLSQTKFNGMLFEELRFLYYKSYIEIDTVLNKYSDLSEFLWRIGSNGISSNEYKHIVSKLPIEFLRLIDSEYMYSEKPINSIDTFESFEFSMSIRVIQLAKRIIMKIRK